MSNKISIVVPVYNEENNIKIFLLLLIKNLQLLKIFPIAKNMRSMKKLIVKE